MNSYQTSVIKTGNGTAALREKETRKEGSLIKDFYAGLLAGDDGRNWLTSLPEKTRLLMIDLLAVRTRIFDDFCTSSTSNKVPFTTPISFGSAELNELPEYLFDNKNLPPSQIVILGAGLDTRAYRLRALSDTSIYEVDFPEVLAKKNAILSREGIKPICKKHVLISSDLSKGHLDRILTQNGFDNKLPTLWILEALTGYLSEMVNKKLIQQLTSLSSPGSMAIATFVGQSEEAYGHDQGKSKKHIFCTNQGPELFRSSGWSATQKKIHQFAEVFNRNKNLEDYDYWVVCAKY